ncbi:MAG: aminotransferase class V-fold PLP-dependent enzyme, partial [Thermodesulfovibrionales bacterium]|nr:aminotransferase class V-fold PLP-dependent enzyme [Thermodesulfovibrionales bacterium]
ILDEGLEKIVGYEHELTEYLVGKLADIEEIQIYAPAADRIATISFNVLGVPPSDVAYFLDREWGICARSGLHCAPEAHKTLGTFPGGTIRFSLSFFNTKKEIDSAIEALKDFVKHR